MILCDIGNSTYHFKDGKKRFKISVLDYKKLPDFKKDEDIYFISVNEEATKKFILKYPKSKNLNDIIKLDTKYKGLGVDRKIVSTAIKNGIIVDIGSAMTLDVVKNSFHLGGYIFPGLNSYKSIYPKISKKLIFKLDTDLELENLPSDTNEAISLAILSSLVYPIKDLYKKYKLPIYLTGGDSKILKKHLKSMKVKYKPNLIFSSMKKIIKENRC